METADHKIILGKQFAPNRSKKNALMMYVIGGLFLLIGLVFFFSSLPRPLNANNVGFILGCCFFGFGAILLLIIFLIGAVNVEYYLLDRAIVLKRGKYVLTIPLGDITEIRILDEKRSEKTILQLEHFDPISSNDRYMNFIPDTRATKVIFEGGRFGSFMFMSVLIASWRMTDGPVSGIDLPCATVEITLKNHDTYLITPLDIDVFLKDVQTKMKTAK